MPHHVLTFGDRVPSVSPDAWLADTAVVIGAATVEAGTGLFYGAVLRGDLESISIGAGSNVQDNATVHADPGFPAVIGRSVSIGHGAVLHGCTVEDGCLIGMHATVLNGATIGAGSLVAAGALVLEGTQVPPRSLVAGLPAKVRRTLTGEEIEGLHHNAEVYRELTKRYRHLPAANSGPAH
ncbi:gamma carbonic anhydrase family protein [Amycolatopsis ultiminotia]|uniref:Gamma carbonic anhydrase family protein n=1 Tax=Amycolatopsis ultiminotia TaxID=543629 RepID=A0ABP6YNW4_9PSEU